MRTLRIISVNVCQPEVLLHWPTGDVISSINKQPVDVDTLKLTEFNLEGDAQADTRPTPTGGQVHGGVDQAVYAFPSEHFPRIAEIIGQPISAGFMGENVTLKGAVEDDVRIGDVWQWGSARLQITAPRGPCFKLGIRIGQQAMRTVLRKEGLVGWYLRVLVPGEVPVRGPITVIDEHAAGVTVGIAHRALQDRTKTYPELAALDIMSANLRAGLMWPNRDLTGGVPEAD